MSPPKGRCRAVALLAALGVLTGCGGQAGVAPPAAAPQRSVAASSAAASVHLSGVLTLKGSEADAWWALSDDSGEVWRLEPAGDSQRVLFRQWQNGRVVVDGARTGTVLRTTIVTVQRIERLP